LVLLAPHANAFAWFVATKILGMGPLFSIAVAGIAIAVFALATFLVVRLRRDSRSSLQHTLAIVAGAVFGGSAAVVLLVPFVGAGSTLTTTGAVIAYLASLCAGCVLGVAFAARLAARLKATKAAPPVARS
jgi:hypothetical protein